MQALTLPAPAKLNLWLHIIGRRADGYHELETVFQFLDHGDELSFAVREDGVIRLHSDLDTVPHDSNLIVRAARQLQAQSGTPLGADIWLNKVLPMGGGIGGGSWSGMKIAWRPWASAWVPMSRYSCAGMPPLPRGWANSSRRSIRNSRGMWCWFRKCL